MADDDDIDVTDDDDGQEAENSPLIKQLRKELKEQKGAKVEAEAAKRELAFLKAGIDTSTGLGKLFAKSFEGDLDPEVIKAEAAELGIISVPDTGNDESDDADGSTEARSNLASGATPDDGSGVHPAQAALAKAKKLQDDGASFERSAGGMVHDLAVAAMNGDRRVLAPG